MLEQFKTIRLLRKAHKLRHLINEVADLESVGPAVEQLKCGMRTTKAIFLSSVAGGRVDSLAPLYGTITRHHETNVSTKVAVPFDLAVDCIGTLHGILEESRARGFLISGTFLGCVREQRILAHDYDIDLGIDVADAGLPKLLALLNSHPNFKLEMAQKITNELAILNDWAHDHAGRPWLLKYLFRGLIRVDLFVHISHQGEIFHGSKRNLWVNSDFSLDRAPLYGFDFYVPGDADKYLTENYGDWRTPIKAFQCMTDTPNSRVIHSVAALKILMKRYVVFGWHGDTKRQKVLLDRIHQCFE